MSSRQKIRMENEAKATECKLQQQQTDQQQNEQHQENSNQSSKPRVRVDTSPLLKSNDQTKANTSYASINNANDFHDIP